MYKCFPRGANSIQPVHKLPSPDGITWPITGELIKIVLQDDIYSLLALQMTATINHGQSYTRHCSNMHIFLLYKKTKERYPDPTLLCVSMRVCSVSSKSCSGHGWPIFATQCAVVSMIAQVFRDEVTQAGSFIWIKFGGKDTSGTDRGVKMIDSMKIGLGSLDFTLNSSFSQQ